MPLTADAELDVRGYECPVPMLRAKARLRQLGSGQLLCVRATDPHALIDIKALCYHQGHSLVEYGNDDDELWIWVRKA